jgi:hypothetical protein
MTQRHLIVRRIVGSRCEETDISAVADRTSA